MTLSLVTTYPFAAQTGMAQPLLVAIVLGTLLCACGSGGDDLPPLAPSGNVGAGWASIASPSPPQATTEFVSITMRGRAFISPSPSRCCTGSVTDTGVTVHWTSTTTGTRSDVIFWSCHASLGTCKGGRYNPGSDTWQSISVIGAPSPRTNAAAVWTGTDMLVWGGFSSTLGHLNDGGLYNPVSNTWRPMSAIGAPGPRSASCLRIPLRGCGRTFTRKRSALLGAQP